MSFESLLNAAVDVYQKNPTKDHSGGQVPGFTAVATLQGLPACIQPKRGTAQITLGQRQVFLTHAIYLESDYGIQRGWKLQNSATGVTYVVHAIIDMGGQARCWRFDCVQET